MDDAKALGAAPQLLSVWAAIASTATADKNSLDTGTLGFSDLQNEADYKVSHAGISLSGCGSYGGDQFKGNMPAGMISTG